MAYFNPAYPCHGVRSYEKYMLFSKDHSIVAFNSIQYEFQKKKKVSQPISKVHKMFMKNHLAAQK
jgi:hypothetical protein